VAVAGRYKALRKIADGGTAAVFLAEQQGAAGFRRLVVLKRIRSSLYSDPEFRRLLVEEAHVAMGLHHSNLVETLDLGESGGRYFLVLELVDGWTLHQLVERAKNAKHELPPAMAVYLCTEISRGLSYAHNRTRAGQRLNIIHRDVCPNNVLVSDTGEVKLTDFGIAKARTRKSQSEVGIVAGKPSYMSPEQAMGEALDQRSDLFSMGTVLYWLLTEELPFRAPNDRELMLRVGSGEFVPPSKLKPSLHKDLVKVVLKAMKRDPAERYQTAQELLTALEQVQRSALEPFGRSELEAWMRALNKKDGLVPVTRESMIPISKPKSEEPEWIELSADELKTAPPHPSAPTQVVPPPPPTSRWGLAVFFLLALAGAAAGTWWGLKLPIPDQLKTYFSDQPQPAQSHIVFLDAGGEAPVPDASVSEPDASVPEPIPVQPDPPPTDTGPVSGRGPGPEAPAQLPTLKVWGRLSSPKPESGDRHMVLLDTDPSGATVTIDRRDLGTTPVSLRFKVGISFELTFAREGYAPRVLWLTLIEQPDRPPRVSLRSPPPR
jgi:serine/threonine protein kinase